MSHAETVRDLAGLPDDEVSLRRADTALGEALLGVVQNYLKRVSSHWDVELFFEMYGRPPRDGGSWSEAIATGLDFRKDFPEEERKALVNESIAIAVSLIRDGSGGRL